MDADRAKSGDGILISLKDTLSVVVGASEGIGAAIALGLARAGSSLVLGGRDGDRMAATVAGVRDQGGSATFESVDVRAPEAIRSFADAVLRNHGAPTILV